jgi:hypothetical protein
VLSGCRREGGNKEPSSAAVFEVVVQPTRVVVFSSQGPEGQSRSCLQLTIQRAAGSFVLQVDKEEDVPKYRSREVALVVNPNCASPTVKSRLVE